ncbi:hypothetical protein [Rhodococcus opacus]|uniref:hypothetical protein n=1 Tax=Rhodococcus opacus TaxID=37919 RepID=UPI00031882F3|nr:hypothetical protein [Rhodococcus opacus]
MPSSSWPRGAARRSLGRRSRSEATRSPTPVDGLSQPKSAPSFHRAANRNLTSRGYFDGRPALLTEMLDEWERRCTKAVIAQADAEGGTLPTESGAWGN